MIFFLIRLFLFFFIFQLTELLFQRVGAAQQGKENESISDDDSINEFYFIFSICTSWALLIWRY